MDLRFSFFFFFVGLDCWGKIFFFFANHVGRVSWGGNFPGFHLRINLFGWCSRVISSAFKVAWRSF